ncbi:hypothetical protein AJ88_03905 [Mesorhizobium amorphae CCBAU 01583]|nr:hypothetical protein AJ88_03905 [Mesorhizobium amorphae CCBAU 01583]
MSSRGPLKERTFNIPDHLIEEFLEHDIELIGRRYARVMAADVELTKMDKRQGGAGKPTLASQLDRVKNDYLTLREAINANPDFEPKAREKALKALAKSEKSDVEDLGGVRDLLRGQYKVDTQHTNYARVLRMAGVFNFMRSLGGVVVSSLSDAARPPMVHGMTRYMGEGIAPLVTNLKAVKLAVEDAKLLGAVTERSLQGRLATMAELADPYASHSPFERFIDNAANVFSKMTLLPWWNDMHKSIASVLVQNRLLKNAAVDYEKLGKAELKYMGFLGVDAHMAERISKQFAEFGDVDGNVHIPGLPTGPMRARGAPSPLRSTRMWIRSSSPSRWLMCSVRSHADGARPPPVQKLRPGLKSKGADARAAGRAWLVYLWRGRHDHDGNAGRLREDERVQS